MTSKPSGAQAVNPSETQTELEGETPDIIPHRTLTAREAEQDYQKQLALLAEQEAEYNARKANGSPLQDDTTDDEQASS